MNEKERNVTGLGEAMGVIIILFLLLPFAALAFRGTAEIINRPVSCTGGSNGR